jgi:hypothetical protein
MELKFAAFAANENITKDNARSFFLGLKDHNEVKRVLLGLNLHFYANARSCSSTAGKFPTAVYVA